VSEAAGVAADPAGDQPSGRRRLFGLVLILVSLGLGLILGEVALRLLEGTVNPGDQRPAFGYDPELGWRPVPGSEHVNSGREHHVVERFNSLGIRGPEYDPEKRAGVARVLFLGDSFTEGYTVEFDRLFSQVMAAQLGRALGREVEAINAGVRAYSTDQELLMWRRLGRHHRPDITVLLFHDNDIHYNTQARAAALLPRDPSANTLELYRAFKPLFEVTADSVRLTNVPTPRAPPAESSRSPASEPPRRGVRAWLTDEIRLFRAARAAAPASFRRALAGLGLVAPERAEVTWAEWEVYRREYTPETERAWQVTEALLAQMAVEVADAGGEFVVFYVPMSASLYADKRDEVRRKYGMDDREWDFDRVRDELARVCRERGIALVPPELFEAEVDSAEERLYLRRDGHWSVAGHRSVATVIANYLESFVVGIDGSLSKDLMNPQVR